MNKLCLSAKWYANNLGWYVVPLHQPLFDETGKYIGCTCEPWQRKKNPKYVCRTPGKHPRIKDWEKEASCDPVTIDYWWQRWPSANVGIAAGKSGLLVFDVDKYKEEYKGNKLLTPADEMTVTNLSGAGGTHLLYQMPEGAEFGNGKGDLPDGIDIRGFGGQFVAPPSMHPSGRRYQWESGFGPNETIVMPLPAAVDKVLRDHQEALLAQIRFEKDVPAPDFSSIFLKPEIVELIHKPAKVGERSETDQKVITALIRAGATNDEIRAVFDHFPIGVEGKMAEKGAHAMQYLAKSIAHARRFWEDKREERITLAMKKMVTA